MTTIETQSFPDHLAVDAPSIIKPIYARLADSPVTDEARALVDAVLALVDAYESLL
ncbi:hypothetical protein [Lichenibacterium dinghuense]|uniref:hypothetical protein n=1 Tax=Lichenibacterium dinghuense TaxID=2895977 RepID=UPI001F29105A|nr:hypothetical protein [Lichenibacterium sp. 6Y81]